MEALLYYYSFTLGAGSLRGIAILSLFAEYPISSLCKSSDSSRPVLACRPILSSNQLRFTGATTSYYKSTPLPYSFTLMPLGRQAFY